MRSSNQPLFDLFQRQRRYTVPLFQRPYVWGRDEQWEPLWNDIVGRAEAILKREEDRSQGDRVGNHFLGAVVLNQVRVYGREVEAVEVIDGQQRLTTLQIMLAAFRDAMKGTSENRIAGDLERLTVHDGVREHENEVFKVWPTNADREEFSAAMSAGSEAALEERYPLRRRKFKRTPDPRPRLVEAYLFFAQSVREFCFEGGEDGSEQTRDTEEYLRTRAHALFEALRRHIQLVVIELEEGDDPQIIFETLNARGVPLLPSDLIRNFVFQKATAQGEDAEKLYTTWWADYDQRRAEGDDDGGAVRRFWKEEERQGRIRRTRLDLFIHYYIQYRSGREQGIGHLFDGFREWWRGEGDRSVAEELKVLRRHSDVFASLFVPTKDSRVDLFARRLDALDTSTVYPLMLMLLVGGADRIPDGDLDGIITDLESYLVRRMVCDLGAKNYNRFFLSILQKIRGTGPITRGLIQGLLLAPEGPAGEWPDDKKFRRAWLEEPAYRTMKGARCGMILRALDRSMGTGKQEAIVIRGKLTVEHVLPQKWAAPAWILPDSEASVPDGDESAEERRTRLLHSFGNLTLLTQKLNSAVSNGSFAKKRPEIAKQSALRLNAYFQETSGWDETAILQRGETLFEHALRTWPHP